MKKILTLVMFAGLFINAQANHRYSELNLRMNDQVLFVASLDQVCFEAPSQVVTFHEVGPGQHHLYAAKVILNHWGHVIRKDVVFDGMIVIPEASKVNAVVNKFGNFKIRKVEPLFAVQAPVCQTPFYNPYVVNNNCGPAAMSNAEFGALLNAISGRNFESTRMQIALGAIHANYFTTSQVDAMMRLMTFESSKLTLAKEAYFKTIDQNIYYMVYDQFTFESSIRDLNSFIGRG